VSQQTAERHSSATEEDPEPDEKDSQADSSHERVRPAGPWRSFRAAWSPLPAFHLVIAGSSVSMLGTKISTLAFPMLVLWLGGSPVLAGFAVFVTVMPGVLLYFPAGMAVDKVDPWRVMIFSETLRGIVAISVAIELLKYGRHVNIVFLILAMLAEEALEMFTTLAERRYLNWMMPSAETKERRSKQASIEARAHVAVLAGRPVAPFLFMLNPLFPFLADAVSFVFSVAGLLSGRGTRGHGRKREADQPDETEGSAVVRKPESARKAGGVGEVIETLRRDRHIWLGSLLMAMTSMVAQALILIFLTEAHSHQFSTATIGVVLAASGLGGAIGSYCSKFVLVPDVIRRGWIPIQMGAWFATCLVLALAGGRSAWWSGCTMFIFSITGAIGNVELSTYLNIRIKDNMLGKVSGIGYAMSIGASALGPVIGGYSVQQYGIKDAIILLLSIVGLMAFCSLFLLRVFRNRRADERDERVDGSVTGKPAAGFLGNSRPVAESPSAVTGSTGESAKVSPGSAKQSVERRQAEIAPSPAFSSYPVYRAASYQDRGFISPAKESTMVDKS
jgi:hypothetical protein